MAREVSVRASGMALTRGKLPVNVSNLIKKHVAQSPEKAAIVFGDRLINYRELDDLVTRTARGLLALGVTRGEVVSLFMPSLPELIIAYLGTVRAGITVNVVDAMLSEQEVTYILNDCDSRTVLVDAARLATIENVLMEATAIKDIVVLGADAENGYLSFEKLLDMGQGDIRLPETKGSDLCHLMYTSDTSGWPKGVMATHLNVFHNATEFGKVHFKPEDRVMVAAPIFHCWGLINGTFGMLSRGGTVIMVERFSPGQALSDIERHRPTVFQGVPPMYNLLLKQPDLDQHDISSVVFCLSAGTKMPENLIRQVEDRLNWRYAEAWGLRVSVPR